MSLSLFRNPLAQMEEEKKEHELKMKKMEAEMEQVFEMKVKEKKQKLKDSEVEMSRRHDDRKKVLKDGHNHQYRTHIKVVYPFAATRGPNSGAGGKTPSFRAREKGLGRA